MKPFTYWTPENFEISSYSYHLSDRINMMYKTSGSDTTGLCTYTYNELGFRGDSIKKQGFKVMSIGCSLTEGVGVNDNETWPAQFCSMIPNGVNLNFGTGGRSNDFISRCLLTYYDLIKPDLVLIMYTYPHRKEIYTKNGNIEPFIPGLKWGFMTTDDGTQTHGLLEELQNTYMDLDNWYRNHLLITNFLKTKNVKFLWNGSFIDSDYTDSNRFDGEYKIFLDKGVDGNHPGPKHNNNYASKLYETIFR